MSVSDPGTATIFTHDVVLCLVKASNMCFMLSVSGGVCEVQKRTCVVPALHPACGAADWPPPQLLAVATIAREISEAFTPRRGSNVIAFSSVAMTVTPRLLPGGPLTGPGRECAGVGPLLLHRNQTLIGQAANYHCRYDMSRKRLVDRARMAHALCCSVE